MQESVPSARVPPTSSPRMTRPTLGTGGLGELAERETRNWGGTAQGAKESRQIAGSGVTQPGRSETILTRPRVSPATLRAVATATGGRSERIGRAGAARSTEWHRSRSMSGELKTEVGVAPRSQQQARGLPAAQVERATRGKRATHVLRRQR